MSIIPEAEWARRYVLEAWVCLSGRWRRVREAIRYRATIADLP